MAEFPGRKFLVFSDDIEWCKIQKIFKDCHFYHGTAIEDLNLMTHCNGHIIGNSTLSWWGAWLSNAKTVIAPKIWFGNSTPIDIIPSRWLQI
jgi:hypothetical protein